MAQMQAARQPSHGPARGTTRRHSRVSESCYYLDLADDVRQWKCPEPVGVAVLCAGMTRFADCQRDPAATFCVNVQGITALAENLAAQGAFVIYLSSNAVFDGFAPFRKPGDPVSPTSEYGRQKAAAETPVLALGGRAAVVRLTKILETNHALFTGWRQALLQGDPIHPFLDLVMAPVPLSFVVAVLRRVIADRSSGIIHVSADRDVTYAQAAYFMAERLRAPARLVQPMRSAQAGIPLEAIPAHTTLDTTRLCQELGLTPPDVWSAIASMLGQERNEDA